MRELIVVFYGNELSLGLMLANWLLWTAVGSSLLGRAAESFNEPRKLVAALQVAIAVVFPLTIWAVRASRGAFQTAPGELLGPWPMFLTSLASLSVFCVLSGFLFAAGSLLYAHSWGETVAVGTASVYMLEAVGSGLGGVLASLILIRYLNAFDIAALVALLNLLAATGLLVQRARDRGAVAAALLGIFAFLVFPLAGPRLESTSLAALWRGYGLIAARNSVYGNLAVTQAEGSRSLYENGLVVFTAPNPEAAEEAVHFALLQHASPKSLLLIGGGVSGSVTQALQHKSLERIEYVELDPVILDLARQYFPTESAAIQVDRRVKVHSADGRRLLKETQSRFDVIIVSLPDPQTAQLNRFYTLEFFQEAAQRLAPGGIFSFQVTGAENYTSPTLAEFLRCLNKTLRAAFPEVTAMPGATVHYFASTRTGALSKDPETLLERLRSRRLHTQYVREYLIPFRWSPDRLRDFAEQIEPQATTPVNHDFAPIAYYFDVVLWGSRFRDVFSEWFARLARIGFGAALGGSTAGILGLIGLSLAVTAGFGRRMTLPDWDRRCRFTAGTCVAAMGFTLMALEMFLLLGFQALYGYVYHQLAILIAIFMLGMAVGTWWQLRRLRRGNDDGERNTVQEGERRADMRLLAGLQIVAAISALLLYELLELLSSVTGGSGIFMASNVLFPGLALLSGMLGGHQFPLASRIYFSGGDGTPRSVGALYGLDLLGACAGAVALSLFFLPVYGFFRTALLIAVVNSIPAALAAFPARVAGHRG
ncbi:MAG: fused MFS/spermidine synthase [Terriglobia bacterium]